MALSPTKLTVWVIYLLTTTYVCSVHWFKIVFYTLHDGIMMCFPKGPLVLRYSRPASPQEWEREKTGGSWAQKNLEIMSKKTGDFAKTSPDLIIQSIHRWRLTISTAVQRSRVKTSCFLVYYQHPVVVLVWIHLNFQLNWSLRRHVILFRFTLKTRHCLWNSPTQESMSGRHSQLALYHCTQTPV